MKKVKESKNVEVVSEKKSLRLNNEAIATQLDKDDVCNWLVIEGLKKFNEGKLGKNMENFLIHIGVLEYSK